MTSENDYAIIAERKIVDKPDFTMKAKQFLMEEMNANTILIKFREQLKPKYNGISRSDFFVDASIIVVGHLVDDGRAWKKAKQFWGNDPAVKQYVDILKGWCDGHAEASSSIEGFQEAFLEVVTGLPYV
jgi:hypothetical protein